MCNSQSGAKTAAAMMQIDHLSSLDRVSRVSCRNFALPLTDAFM